MYEFFGREREEAKKMKMKGQEKERKDNNGRR